MMIFFIDFLFVDFHRRLRIFNFYVGNRDNYIIINEWIEYLREYLFWIVLLRYYLLKAIRGFDPSFSNIPIWSIWNWEFGLHINFWIGFLDLSGLILSQEFNPPGRLVRLFIFPNSFIFYIINIILHKRSFIYSLYKAKVTKQYT